MLKYLCFIEPIYVKLVYNKIIEIIKIDDFMKPYIDYFKTNFIEGYNIKTWNYWGIFKNRTNNCCEGYNSKLNDYFKTKPHIYKLLMKLKEEEVVIYKNYMQNELYLI